MPSLPEHPRFKGISLPPSGWVLAVLLVVYIFVGLIGHDPWKHDDAVSIGLVYDIVRNGHWLTPQLAGQIYPDAPFYYWTAAITAHLFSWLMPIHDAARLASGLFTLLALEFILLAARELHGREHAAAAPLILAGSIGFLYHAHEAQPMLAALTAHTAAYWAVALLPRRPRLAALVFGTALALGFLANGLLPVVTLLPAGLFFFWRGEGSTKPLQKLALALVVAVLLASLWLVPLYWIAPRYAAGFLSSEAEALTQPVQFAANSLRYLNMLLWYAWPALPLAAWAMWSKRRQLRVREIAIPVGTFFATLLVLGLCYETRSSATLMLLPPLVLLSVPGVATLRRGAANAFDWFGMMTFSFFAAVVWIVWSAMVFGWPTRLARQAVRLEPGFVGHFSLIACAFAVLLTLIWFWLIVTSPRSPMRGIMHWMAGLTLFWVLIAVLWMPWIDYGKSYRPLSASLARALPTDMDCVASANLPDSILASLDYFDDIRTIPLRDKASKRCKGLLLLGSARNPETLSASGWRQIWEGKRPGDRRDSDRFHLYRRVGKAKSTTELSDISVATTPE